MCGRISEAPSAQLTPTLSSGAWEMEFQQASTVWPDNVRPEASVMVMEAITGSFVPVSAKYFSMANSAALRFSVSNVVSGRRMSTPPSTSPRTCS
jgi:hypothetical protein